MISVLIPVYNDQVRFLVEEIYRQANEQDKAFEILLADDASSLPQILADYDDLKALAKVFTFEKNHGRTYTRNFLAQKAQFENLLFLDADVIPKNPDFIKQFIQYHSSADLIFGGIAYTEETPQQNQLLRWKYGRKREAKTLEERKINPYYTIISGAIFVKKEIFLQANQELENLYGLDSVFVENLKSLNAKILHIDNPVIHLGLESDENFIKKTENGLKSLVYLEHKGKVSLDYRPVQKAFLKLKSLHLTKIFQFFFNLVQHKIRKNLLGKNPSLFYFDLYKLNFYIDCKKR